MIQYTKTYIQKLLDKFMAGTSTLEEEDILNQYFAQEHVPAEWEQYRLLFAELESMRPTVKPQRKWLRWSIAAAVTAILLLTLWTRLNQPSVQPLMAEDKTEQKDSLEQHRNDSPDTIQHQSPAPTILAPEAPKKRHLRKSHPTLTDYDKAYALMAEAEQERQDAERQIAEAEQEMIDAYLQAAGFEPIMQEDSTIIYVNGQLNYLTYEE